MFESFSGCNIINRPIIVNFWSICGTFHPLTSANRFYMTLNFKWNCSPLIFIRCRNYHNSTNFRQMALFQTETLDKIWGKRSIFGFFLQFLPPNTLNCGPNDWNFPENTVFLIVYKISKSHHDHCVKSVRFWSYSGPYFPAYGPNTKRYSVSLRIQSECGKIRTRITLNTDKFYAVDCTIFQLLAQLKRSFFFEHFLRFSVKFTPWGWCRSKLLMWLLAFFT